MIKHKWTKLIMALAATFILSACGQTEVVKPETGILPTPKPTVVEKMATWNDEAGFTFEYPENLKVVPNASDNDSYANLMVGSDIKIMAVDSKYKTVEDWVKKEMLFKDASIIDTTLSGKTAKKILLDGKTVVGTIDDNILFTIESNGNAGNNLIDSFVLTTPTPAKAKATTSTESSGDEVVLEEEVVE
jgi:hypothetical protein